MLKKILILSLMMGIFALGTNLNVFANTNTDDNVKNTEQSLNKTSNDKKVTENLKQSILKKENNSFDLTDKDNLSSYNKSKNKGNGFSTKTKIAIGVGIAAVAVGVFIFAASRDKLRFNGYGF